LANGRVTGTDEAVEKKRGKRCEKKKIIKESIGKKTFFYNLLNGSF
jgi:hypothetical protein